MCMHITAENKWFVTGTPIQREISGEWIFVRYHKCMGSLCTYLSTCMYTYCTCACTYSTCTHVQYILHMYACTYSTCTPVRMPHVPACTYSTCTPVRTPPVRMYVLPIHTCTYYTCTYVLYMCMYWSLKSFSQIHLPCTCVHMTCPFLSDLYGLLLLLGVKPYMTKYWWNQLLWQPYLKYNLQPIAQVFSKLLWRNNKKDVASEVGWLLTTLV